MQVCNTAHCVDVYRVIHHTLQAKAFADNFLTTPMAKGQYKMMTKEEIAAINFCESL